MVKYQNQPLKLRFNIANGNYKADLSITAKEDAIYTIYSQNRRFMAKDVKIQAGETQIITCVINACDYIRRDASYKVDGVEIEIACDSELSVEMSVSQIDVPTLYIIGDSTVTDQPCEYPYVPERTYCGWGQVFPMLLDNGIAVSNHSESGATTAEAIDIHFRAIKDKIKKGDFLMIEFGHNDQKQPELAAFDGYAKNLRRFVEYAKMRGVTPVLNSSVNRIIFDENGKILNLLGDYRNAVWSVAKEYSVPFIDMLKVTTDFFEPLGLYTAKKYFRHDGEEQDYTHTNDLGGEIVAKLCAGLIKEADITGLSEHIIADRINIERPEPDKNAPKESNVGEFERLKSIGLGMVPADLDADISKECFKC